MTFAEVRPPAVVRGAPVPSARVRWALAGAAVLITIARHLPVPAEVPHAGILRRFFVDPWLLSYDAGFVRRGLLGAIGHALGDITHNLIVLHVVAATVAAAILYSVLRQLSRGLPPGWPIVIVSVAIALSPVTAVLVLTFGDTAHVTLVAGGLVMPWIWRWPVRRALVCAMVLIAVLTLVHEASPFLIGPALLALLWLRGARWPSAVLAVWVAACALGLGVLGEISATQQAQLIPTMTASWMPGGDPVLRTQRTAPLFRSFRELYADEALRLTLPIVTYRAIWLIRALAVPALLCVLVATVSRNLGWHTLRLWMVLVIAAGPLFVIGHDWGRFAIYLWVLALGVSVTAIPPDDTAPASGVLGPALVALLLLLMNPASPMYHVYGIPVSSLLIGLAAAPCLWWVWRMTGPPRTERAAPR